MFLAIKGSCSQGSERGASKEVLGALAPGQGVWEGLRPFKEAKRFGEHKPPNVGQEI